MYSAVDIGRYIINYSNSKGYGISNLKLQKLLYFVQAYFLINSNGDEACFFDRIEAWDFGPVVPNVYREFSENGSCNIPTITSYLVFGPGGISGIRRVAYDDSMIDKKDKKLIEKIVDDLSAYSASTLVRITHMQEPWKSTYNKGENNEITVEKLKEFFVNAE